MFCSQCGSKIDEGAKFCAQCGTPVTRNVSAAQSYAAPSAQPVYAEPRRAQYDRCDGCARQNVDKNKNGDNVVGLVGFILAFICPLAGLICSIIGYSNAKKGAPYRGLSVAGIIISAIAVGASVLYAVVMFLWIFAFPWYL